MAHMQALATLPAVAAQLRARLADLPAPARPAPWWSPDVDLALLSALHRQGIADVSLIRRHPGMLQAAWQQVGGGWGVAGGRWWLAVPCCVQPDGGTRGHWQMLGLL